MTASTDRRTPRALGLLVVVLVALVTPARPATGAVERRSPKRPAWPSDVVPGSLLVTTADGDVQVVDVEPGTEAVAAARLSGQPGVLAVEPDHLRHVLRTPNDPGFVSGEQWPHALTNASAAWDLTTGSPSVRVAVIDSGIDATHPDLKPNVVRQVDTSSGEVVERPVGVDNDPCKIGHGTAVAGVIGAVGDNGRDVAGVAWGVGIVDVAAGDPGRCGSFSDSAIVAAIQFAVDQDVDVVNLSLGAPGDTCPTAFDSVIKRALAKNIVVVAAAGNEELQFPGLTSVPASCAGVLSVGATNEAGGHASYSNSNVQVDLAAPGGDARGSGGRDVLTTVRGGATGALEGTSFASPYVAGAVALMLSANPTLTALNVESILESTAVRNTGRTPDLGWGRINVGAAVAAAKAGGTIAAPAADPSFPVGLVVRVSAQEPTTNPVKQAVAISSYVFPNGRAQHVIIARRDDFADALAGSALGFGAGPILFTNRTGPLDATTSRELTRVLATGGRVYLLGGTAALPAALEGELRAKGYAPQRLAGTSREGTAAAVAHEAMTRIAELGFDPPKKVILATAFQWPDAVSAGSLGAWFGYPVLLTGANALSPTTRDALASLKPQTVYVVGGTAAVSNAVATAAQQAAGAAGLVRLAGPDRSSTAIAVANQFRTEFRAESGDIDPLLAIGVNLRRADGFTHVLSASAAIGAFSGVYLPVEGNGGDNVPSSVIGLACQLDPVRGVVAGDADLVKEAAKVRLNSLLEHTAAECK